MAGHVCPWWLGYFHLGPIRRWLQNPDTILSPYVRPGMRILDIGSGMGFFTLEAAKLAGAEGRVVAIDLQPRMISTLVRRARRAGLDGRIDARVCSADDLGAADLTGSIDLAFVFYVVHEVEDVPGFMKQVQELLVTGGRFLMVEPMNHQSKEDFERCVGAACDVGFSIVERPEIRRSRSVLLAKD